MNKILTLDLGTHTGFAISISNIVVASGTKALKKSDKLASRIREFSYWLGSTLKKYEIDTVIYEDVKAHKGVLAAHLYGGFLFTMASVCEEMKIDYVGIGVTTIKKSATGKGNANKHEMIAAVKRLGFDPVDDNEADAVSILTCIFKDIKIEAQSKSFDNKGDSKVLYNRGLIRASAPRNLSSGADFLKG